MSEPHALATGAHCEGEERLVGAERVNASGDREDHANRNETNRGRGVRLVDTELETGAQACAAERVDELVDGLGIGVAAAGLVDPRRRRRKPIANDAFVLACVRDDARHRGVGTVSERARESAPSPWAASA